jgi:hypothetical protein
MTIEVRRLRTWVACASVGLLLISAACTLILDRSTTECQSDADCLKFDVHPLCKNGACENTGIACSLAAPVTSAEFLNQCNTGECLPFNDCTRLGVCDGAGPQLVDPAPPEAGTTASDAADSADSIPSCADLPQGPAGMGTVYVTGSSNFPTLLASVAPLIWQGGPPNEQGPAVVYLTTNSCTGADSVFSPDAGAHVIYDPPPGASLTKYAQYYLPDGGTQPCSLGPNGTAVDVGESDVYSTTCDPTYTLTVQTDTLGPIQAMAFVVPSNSDQQSISQEAAREVFGTGGNDGGAYPWINPDRYYVRNKNTGTQQMIGNAIGVPPNEFWGIDRQSAQNVHDLLASLTSNPTEAEEAIGIIAVDVYDSDRSDLRALAYKAQGQNCAYLPDSTAATYDKQNVRDGHYPIWGPLHFFTANNAPTQATSFLSYFNGATYIPLILDAFIDASLIPNCAMTVQREGNVELGALTSFTPTQSCACYFLSEAQPPPGTPPTPLPPECQTCTVSSDGASNCPAVRPHCNFGFCEVQ